MDTPHAQLQFTNWTPRIIHLSFMAGRLRLAFTNGKTGPDLSMDEPLEALIVELNTQFKGASIPSVLFPSQPAREASERVGANF